MIKKTEKASPAVKKSISKDEFLAEIGEKAYELFLERDKQPGYDLRNWLEAEKIIKEKYNL
jgi:hypothetical protein